MKKTLFGTIDQCPVYKYTLTNGVMEADILTYGGTITAVYNFLNRLATQYILTYCTNRTLTYHLYADECDLFVFGASLTSSLQIV